MQKDFHYYATYCAAYLAGYSHEECLEICYAAQMVDCLTATLLKKIKGPVAAATTQSQIELTNINLDILGRQNVTRIWSSFHFLPYDLYVKIPKRPRYYKDKYRLICKPNGDLIEKTIKLAKGKGTQATGIAMHVMADTWAHSYFAGTPARVINNVNYYFYELIGKDEQVQERRISFKHKPATPDDPVDGIYSGSVSREKENSIMNLGHGRAGHLPDYSFARYKYLPAWADYEIVEKDNVSDYYNAFSQMVYAMRYLRGGVDVFEKDKYAMWIIEPWKDTIKSILEKRQIDSSNDWKALGEKLSGKVIADFDLDKYQEEYMNAGDAQRDNTYLGRFIMAAMAQKSMVTHEIYKSGNMLAGFSIEYDWKHFKGIKDFKRLINNQAIGRNNE